MLEQERQLISQNLYHNHCADMRVLLSKFLLPAPEFCTCALSAQQTTKIAVIRCFACWKKDLVLMRVRFGVNRLAASSYERK